MNIVLFGPPGAGKSTFANKLVHLFQLNHISTGDLLRDNLARCTPLGRQVKGYLEVGALVPDDVAINLLSDRVRDTGNSSLLLDGFPRTLTQSIALDHLIKVDIVINIVSQDKELIQRLVSRARAGETAEIIANRIAVYKAQSEPCLEYYATKILKGDTNTRLININGSGSIDEVFERIKGAVR